MGKTLGKRIGFHRKRMGMTQEQLAERLGISAQAVSKWENDQSCPDISLLPELAKIFGVTVDELLNDEPQGVHFAEPVEREEESKGGFQIVKESRGKTVKNVLWFAGFLLLVGGIWLTASILCLDVSWWTITWTSGLFIFGLAAFCRKWSAFGLVVSLTGLYFGLSAFGVLRWNLGWNLVLPLLLIVWAISLLFDALFSRHRAKKRLRFIGNSNGGKHMHHVACEEGMLECEMYFGDSRANPEIEQLRGGRIETAFGDYVVDFSGVKTVAAQCALDVEVNFGSLTVLMPKRYRVEVHEEDGKFSAIQTKGEPNPNPEGVIRFNAEVDFGNMEIRYPS